MESKKIAFLSILVIFFSLSLVSSLPTPTITTTSQIQKTLLTQESDYNSDGIPDVITTFIQLNDTLIEIKVTQTNPNTKGGNAYKWQSGLFILEGYGQIKGMYEDAQGGFANAYPIDLNLYDYQWTTKWNISGNYNGYALFGSGNGNKTYRLIIPETIKKVKIFTGTSSEEVIYETISETTYEYPTASFDYDDFLIDFYCNGEQLDFPTASIISNQEIGTGVKWSLKVPENYSCIGEFTAKHNKLEEVIPKFSSQFLTESERYFIDYADFEGSELNNITDIRIDNVLTEESLWNNFVDWFLGIFGVEPNESLRTIGYNKTWTGEFYDFDPSLQYTFTSTAYGFYNKTEASSLGARLNAPVLFMDFNQNSSATNNATMKYVQDNSIYNNFGLIGNATSSASQPKWNASCTSGAGGGCYQFDGVNDYIDLGSGLNSLTEISVSTWVKKNDDYTNTPNIFTITAHDSGNIFGFVFNQDDIRYTNYQSSQTYEVRANDTGVIKDTWYHIVGTFDGITWAVYLDGILLNSKEDAVALDLNGNAEIGRGGWASPTNYFNGSIDQVQIWDRALSADEVLNLYNGTINNSNYIGKYASDGNFKSWVFYNLTSTFWNTTLSIADSNGSAEVYDLCSADANCVSYWDLDIGNTDSNPYNDEKGSNHGTPTGTNNATGISSGAMRFDGVDDQVDMGNIDATSLTGLTYSYWIKTETNGRPILSWKDERFCVIGTVSANKINCPVDGGSAGSATTTTTITDNQWYHIALTSTASAQIIYVNGVQEDTASETLDTTGGVFRLGNYTTAGGVYFNGSIDEVLIYNKSLTASEVEQLYKAGLSQHANTNITLETRTATSYNISDAGLVSLWDFNDGDAVDRTGRNNGTATRTVFNEGNGTVGYGGYFNGTGSYVNLNNPVSLQITQEQTVSLWMKHSSSPSVDYLVSKYDTAAGQRGFSIGYDNSTACGTGKLVFTISNQTAPFAGGQICTSSTYNQVGIWYHIITVYKPNEYMKIYVDGIEVNYTYTAGSAPNKIANSTRNLAVGASYSNNTLPIGGSFHGSIDEVRIYNRSLSQAEIQNLYELGSYHIEWNDWQDEGVVEDGVAKTSTDLGKFMQFKSVFNTNDTAVSPYLINYSTSIGTEPISPTACPNYMEGNGTILNPCQISNWTNLNATRDSLTLNYTLINNLTSTDTDYDGIGNNWQPIGSNSNPFTGNFDGQNHSIGILNNAEYSTSYSGLFSYIRGNISNLYIFWNESYTSANYFGGLAGFQDGGKIDNVHIVLENINASNYVGGITGQNNGTIKNSDAYVIIYPESGVGGISGWNEGLIENSYSIGTIYATGIDVGGIAGQNTGTILNSYSLINTYGDDSLGGLVGNLNGGNITNSYSNGLIAGNTNLGGLVGFTTGGIVTNSYWDNQTSGQSTSQGGTGKTTAQMKSIETYTDWNISKTLIDLNNGYPYLGWQGDNESYVCLIYYIDITAPQFNLIPNNDTITYGEDWAGVQFNATDDTLPLVWSVNDSRFTINSTGFLDNQSILGAGEYYLNVSVNDSATPSNQNSTVYLLNVTKATPSIELYLDGGHANREIDITGTVNIEGQLDIGEFGTLNLTINGAEVNSTTTERNLTYTFNPMGLGLYQVWLNYSDNTNYTSAYANFNITVTHVGIPTVNIVYPESMTYYGTTILDLNYTVDEPVPDSCWYSKDYGVTNSSAVTSGENFTGVEGTSLEENHWTVYCNDTAGNVGYHTHSFYIDITPPEFTTIPSNASITYGDSWSGVTFVATDSGVGFGSYFINDSNFNMNNGLITWISQLAVGSYYINVSANDTLGNTNSVVFLLTITQATSTLTLGAMPDWLVYNGTETIVTGSGCPAQLTCNLYESGDEVSNPNTQTLAIGNYVYIYNTTGNQNYTTYSATNTIIVSAIPTGTTAVAVVCPWDIFGYFDFSKPTIKQTGCHTRTW